MAATPGGDSGHQMRLSSPASFFFSHSPELGRLPAELAAAWAFEREAMSPVSVKKDGQGTVKGRQGAQNEFS